MAKRQFHLSWFLSQGYGPKSWRGNWPGSSSDMARWMMPDLFLDLARGLERACFDYLIIEDSSMVPYTYQGSHDTYLRYAASTPKLDPAVLVPYLAQATAASRADPDPVGDGVPALPAGAAGQFARPRDRGACRMELRHQQQ